MHLRLDVEIRVSGRPLLKADLDSTASSWLVSGPSGSGKSTLVRMLAGAAVEASGRAEVDGAAWLGAGAVPSWQRRVGWMPQESLLFPHLSVSENLSFGHDPQRDGPRFAELAEGLELGSLLRRQPRHLSGGEKQRVALGRALLSGPRLLLLDEPFSALDRALRARVIETVRTTCNQWRIPCLIVSHDLRELERFGAVELEVQEGRVLTTNPRSTTS